MNEIGQLLLSLKHFKESHDEANASAVKWCELLGITPDDWTHWKDFTPLIAKLAEDRARLDWLDENMSYNGGGNGGTYSFTTPADVECGMLRAAIDAARKKQ